MAVYIVYRDKVPFSRKRRPLKDKVVESIAVESVETPKRRRTNFSHRIRIKTFAAITNWKKRNGSEQLHALILLRNLGVSHLGGCDIDKRYKTLLKRMHLT